MATIPDQPKKRIIALKIYFDRARMYLGYINFFMLNLLLINSYDNPEIKAFIHEYKLMVVPVLFLVYMLLLIFIGYMDTKLGFRQEEMRNNASINPVMQDLVKTVNEIRDEIKKN